MKKEKIILIVINVILGTLVLASYAHGILTHPESAGKLWGEVPEILLPFYTVSMFTAATGYFLFTYYILFRLEPGEVKLRKKWGYPFFLWTYGVILLPSVLWMPLTFMMIAAPSLTLWIAIRLVLATVGLGTLALAWGVHQAKPVGSPVSRKLALLGCLTFAFQTVVLDALVWTAYFPVNV